MGKGYLDDWDAWDAYQKTGVKSQGGGNVVEFKGGGSKHDTHYHTAERCFHKHPPLKLPGTELVIYGGSCLTPAVKDADVYIGFDHSMALTERSWPWKQGTEFLFKIRDMSVPDKPDEFRKLIAWTKKQLEDGKKVHCGCIGGHGRTGTFLAALCSEYGEKDAIAYVRKNYCPKAVESSEQVTFLHDQFGITKVDGYKAHSPAPTHSSKPSASSGKPTTGKQSGGAVDKFSYVAGNGCIWNAPAA